MEHRTFGRQQQAQRDARGVEQSADALADYIEFSRVDVLGLVEIYGNSAGGSKNRVFDRTFAVLNANGGANWKYLLFDRGNRQLTGASRGTRRLSTKPARCIAWSSAPEHQPPARRATASGIGIPMWSSSATPARPT